MDLQFPGELLYQFKRRVYLTTPGYTPMLSYLQALIDSAKEENEELWTAQALIFSIRQQTVKLQALSNKVLGPDHTLRAIVDHALHLINTPPIAREGDTV